ncbi:MAG TPA: carbohydrate ABC transporter permease [Mesorhizobium sp.]|nr:carbohydrate ABC transporter permease [Mesorhizobium sp.]HEV2507715.1 carbohydrate ABC transporter permease [Mesorhizobium sp.]
MTATILVYVAVAVFVVSILAPVAWLFIMSISDANDLTTIPLRWIPEQPDFSRYARLFSLEEGSAGLAFLSALRNSVVVALSATAIALAAGIPAAYSFSRFPGRMPLLYAVIVTYMMPPVALILPLYKVFSTLGLLNNVTSLIIVYCTILLPFVTWLMKSGFDSVPVEIEQAASIDGANLFQILTRITLPVAAASTGAAALFALLLAWDEFFYALLYTSDTRAKTLPVAIADFAAGRATDYGLISAVGLLAALPPVLIGFFLQKSLLSGLSAGSVKG